MDFSDTVEIEVTKLMVLAVPAVRVPASASRVLGKSPRSGSYPLVRVTPDGKTKRRA